MSDDWLKKAEERREQHQRETGGADAEREAGGKAFFEESKGQVAAILSEVGELWKSMDPHHAVLGVVTTHAGHDYRVHVDKYQSPSGIELYLFDKSNMLLMHDKYAKEGLYGVLSASVRVLIEDGHFVAYMTNGPGEWIDRKAQTIDELKAVIADLWAAGQITVSK
ncbi:MAG: hypothetical protein ACYDEO_14070 [Aggregatilineales bacterium]